MNALSSCERNRLSVRVLKVGNIMKSLISSIRGAIQDLTDLLTIFPDHQLAKKFKKSARKGIRKTVKSNER